MGGRAERSQFGRVILRRPHFEAGDRCAQLFHQRGINALLGINPARRRTVLSGIVETKRPHPFDNRILVSIIKDDNRRFTAQLHVGAFNGGRGMADDMFPGSNRTGQRDHTDFFMPGQRIAHRFPPAKQDVQHTCREDIFSQLSQLQRGEGRDL